VEGPVTAKKILGGSWRIMDLKKLHYTRMDGNETKLPLAQEFDEK
jgi:hypothetical protein